MTAMIGGVFCGFWCGCWGFCRLWECSLSVFLGGVRRFFCKMILFFENCLYLCSPKTESNSPVAVFETSSGCSSARLEYTSGGRGVASSNLVTPTKQSKSLQSKDWRLLCYKARSCLHVCGLCCTKVLALQGLAFALFGSLQPTITERRATSRGS